MSVTAKGKFLQFRSKSSKIYYNWFSQRYNIFVCHHFQVFISTYAEVFYPVDILKHTYFPSTFSKDDHIWCCIVFFIAAKHIHIHTNNRYHNLFKIVRLKGPRLFSGRFQNNYFKQDNFLF